MLCVAKIIDVKSAIPESDINGAFNQNSSRRASDPLIKLSEGCTP